MGIARSDLSVSVIALSVALAWTAPALADERKAEIRGDLPGDLREAIINAVGDVDTPPSSRLEARRRAQQAGEDAIAVLRSEGYYAYIVEPDITEGDPAQAFVTIDPGPRFTIAVPLITWLDPAPPAPVQEKGQTAMDLPEGRPGRAAAVVAAEGRIVAATQQAGYADASANDRVVIVDHDSTSVIPEFRIDAGPLVHLDGIDLRTDGRTNPAWVRQLAPWKEGDVYAPQDVAELERRLRDAGVYQSITVALAPQEDIKADGNRPVVVSLADRPRGILELGAGYSTNEGAGIDARYQRFNRLGRADTLTLIFSLARIQSKIDAEIAFPHWRVADRTLTVGTGLYNNVTDAYTERGANLRADITKHYNKTSYRTLGVAVDYGRIEETYPTARTRNVATITGLGALNWDRSNDPLNPTRGWRLDARAEPTISAGNGASLYVRTQAQATGYLPLGRGAGTVLAGRLKVGSIVGASLNDIPQSRRFYSGGGGSVRGYDYQGVGPRFTQNTPQGGLGLFEGSFEVRQTFTKRWGGVAFVDVGSISATETPDFSNTSAGVGFGVRYNLGFGPIRADVAVPINRRTGDPTYQIYLSIGQSF